MTTRVKDSSSSSSVDVRPLAARVHADQLMTQKIELGLRCGQILGPEYDGVPFEDVCRELVQLKAAAARVHALIAQISDQTFRMEHAQDEANCPRCIVYQRIHALEAALAAALAPHPARPEK